MRTSIPAGSALAILFCFARGVSAQPASDVDAAESLFQGAKAAMDHGDLLSACPQFAESQRLDPAAGTLLNLGECEVRMGRLATALGHFQEARATLPVGDYRVAFADAKIAKLQRRVPRLTVRVRGELPAGAKVQRDGVEVAIGSLGAATPVDPGEHVVTLTVEGGVLAKNLVRLEEGGVETSELATAPAALPAPVTVQSGSPQRTAAWVLLGTGVAGLAAGTVLGLVAKGTYDSASSRGNCPSGPSSCNSSGVQGGQTAHSEAAASTAAFLAGGILAGLGATLYFTAPREGRVVALAPLVSPEAAGLAVGGAF